MTTIDPTTVAEMTAEHYAIQAAFVAEYILEFSAIKAARKAGYIGTTPGKKGKAILEWPGTSVLIRTEIEAIAAKNRISKNTLIYKMLGALEEAENAEVPRPLDSAKIVEMLNKLSGFDHVAEDKEMRVVIEQFTAMSSCPHCPHCAKLAAEKVTEEDKKSTEKGKDPE